MLPFLFLAAVRAALGLQLCEALGCNERSPARRWELKNICLSNKIISESLSAESTEKRTAAAAAETERAAGNTRRGNDVAETTI